LQRSTSEPSSAAGGGCSQASRAPGEAVTEVRYTATAKGNLLEIWPVIARDNPAAADRVRDAIDDAARLLASQPRMGRERPEPATGIRSFPTKTPCIIFYQQAHDGVTVVRVLHHARDTDAVFSSQ
jgi:plasmid stabilization system protein ParE